MHSSKRPGNLISPSPVHFNRYGLFYRDFLAETFKGYEAGFVSEMFEIYAQSPFLLKFGLLFLIRNEVLDSDKVIELLVKKLFDDQLEHLAVIIEVIDELRSGFILEGRQEKLAAAKNALYGDIIFSSRQKTLLQNKALEFLFEN
jgi:hypothetical protein